MMAGVAVLAVAGLTAGVVSSAHASGGIPAAMPERAGAGRGTVVSAVLDTRLSVSQAGAYLQQHGYATPSARFGVDIYRVVYRTLDARGEPTTASGVVVFPAGKRGTLRPVVFEHGTMLDKQDAPSTSADDRAEVTLFGGAGYAAVEPDYLGLGLGPGRHPYMDPVSEATASVDMLAAASAVATGSGHRLDPRVLVAGFSQGGQAAMALSRALQGGADPRARLAAVAGISGPYDIEHAEAPAALDGHTLDPRIAAFYLGYWVTAQNRYYHFYGDPAQAFQAPYDKTAENLFDGYHADTNVINAVPADPQELFTPQFIQRLAHPAGSILAAERAADTTCTTWTPRVPVHLYAADDDHQVTNLNSKLCAQALTSRGADVSLIDLGPLDHFPSEKAALPTVVTWFESILRP